MTDIIHNADLLTSFVSDVSPETFHREVMRQMAVEKGIERIGEAMKNLRARSSKNIPK